MQASKIVYHANKDYLKLHILEIPLSGVKSIV